MATILQIKRSSSVGTPATLKLGELAYSYGAGTYNNLGDRLFIGTGGVDGNGDALVIDTIGGKYFTGLLQGFAPGTLTASKALVVDSNKALDEIIVGNDTAAGGRIKLNEGTNNGTDFVTIQSPAALTSSYTLTLPPNDGTPGQFLKTDGSGVLTFDTIYSNIELAGDTGTDTYNTNETLTFTGGTGLDTAITNNTVTINITNSGVDTNQIADDAVTNAKLSTNGEFTLGSTGMQLGATTTDIAGLTSLVIDDITINGQSITTTASNKDIFLTPHGTGVVKVPSAYKDRAGFDVDTLTTKEYVDQVATGLDVKDSAIAATTVNLNATYNNGSSGVGATLTASTNGVLTLDGVTPSLNDRILVKDETTFKEYNGIYVVTDEGSGSSPWELTRATDADEPSELTGGSFVFVESGTANGGNGYVFTHTGTPTFGTTDLPVSQFSGAGQIEAGDALTKSGNRLDVTTDNSSIEVNADALQVKALGVTNAMLAGSIQTNKLANPVIYFTDESSSQGQVSLEGVFEINGGEGINTIISGNGLRIEGELASTSNIGVASFNSSNFTVTSGDVEVTQIDGGTY
jgi:hypothetical protein